MSADTIRNTVDAIMSCATNSPNPEISLSGRDWVEWRKKERTKSAEQ